MKSLLCFLLLFSGLHATQGAGLPSAQAGLRRVTQSVGVSIAPRMVDVVGTEGSDQPPTWLYIIRNERGLYFEFKVTNGRYVGSRAVPTFPSGTEILPKRWKIDSTAAFLIVEKLARQAKVGFDKVNYHLRCAELSDRPAWFLTLLDERGNAVGMITLSADSGTVMSKTFPASASAPAPSQTQYYTPGYQAPQLVPVPEEPGLPRRLLQGATQVKGRVTNWIGEIFGRSSAPVPAPSSYPFGEPVR